MSDASEFEHAVAEHDAALRALGLDIWIGNEPTFTDRHSQAAEWQTSALGEDKHRRAEGVLVKLARDQPGCAVVRCIGRQYPGETAPRWSIGLYARRDGAPVWSGPPDPLLAAAAPLPELGLFHAELGAALGRRGYACRAFRGPSDWRIAFACDDAAALPDPESDTRLMRPSIHDAEIGPSGLRDELSAGGLFLLILTRRCDAKGEVACLELPAIGDVQLYRELLATVAEAAHACALPALILRGFAPPVDPSVSFATVTPDPAVVEVNMAPHPSVLAFLQHNRRCYAAAAELGLSPYRLYYNGTVADSGGGGQITIGGPWPATSPFFIVPQLLPRLVRYVARHPSLSYLFAHEYVGASGQSVRPDELGADALSELKLTLALLACETRPDPATLWRSLAPCLIDPTGNSHRAEINIEKLWNPHLAARGQLGLVEFRAFRMQHTPERVAALATLLRALLAMLMTRDSSEELAEWGAALHDRFALPFYLEADLGEVLRDLAAVRVGLGPALISELATDPWREWSTVEYAGSTLTIRRALEFWSLVGDASHQLGTARLVDASTCRIELSLRSMCSDADALAAFRLQANGIELPLSAESDARGPTRVFGLRYRSFASTIGFHPTLGAQGPLRLLLLHPRETEALEMTLHEWKPEGGAYEDVPADLREAGARRVARCATRLVPTDEQPPANAAPPGSLSACTLDLRYLPVLDRRNETGGPREG